MNNYKNLFSPITIKHMTVRNRVAMPPMGTNYGGAMGDFTDEHITYYEKRAEGGTGLIIVENACVDFPLGSNGTTQIRLDHDRYIPNLFKLTERLHRQGASVAIQINHSGASAVPGRIEGNTPVSSSNIPSKTGGAVPRPLEIEEIHAIVHKYAEAAKRAQIAGFDAVEIHGGHSYLLCQFLSPVYNKRTDEFGGSVENRTRFARLVLKAVREAVGPMFPISFRFSAEELVEGGNTLEDSLEMLEYLQEDADILNVSAALNDSLQYQIDANYLEDGWRSYMAKAVKEKYPEKVVITSGNIRNPKIAERIIEEGHADMVAIGRGLIAEPQWVNKVKSGREDELRKCISCNIACSGHRIGLNRPVRCTVNPSVIFGDIHKELKVNKATNVVVIGGGTAGLEAACTAAEVGCTTFLFEAKPYLGGLAREIAKLPAKDRINDFPDYLINRAKKLKNLYIFTNTTATIEAIENLKPDVVVNATGSNPLLPPITGLHNVVDKENEKVMSIFGFIKNIKEFEAMKLESKKIGVIGGGAVGLDVVEYFANKGARVTIVERMPAVGNGLDFISKIDFLSMLKKKEVDVRVDTSLLEVKPNSFIINKDGVDEELEFDFGFVCLGMRAYSPLMNELEEKFASNGVEVVNIGDSVRARRIIEGVDEGRNITDTLKRIGRL